MKKHLLALLVALTIPATAFANAKKEAKEHIDKATAFHAEGKFKEALDELTIAYTLDPKPELLYAIGQVHVQLGNCPQAITFYQRFLGTKPAAGPAAAAKEAIETCKNVDANPRPDPKPDPKPDPVVDPKPDPVPPKPDVAVKEDEPPGISQPPPRNETPAGPKPWYKDMIGDALVIGGVGLSVASVIFYTQMNGKLDDADNAPTYPEVEKARDDASSKQKLAIGFGVGGVVLIGAGIARYMLRDKGESNNKVVVAPTNDGGYVTWMGRF